LCELKKKVLVFGRSGHGTALCKIAHEACSGRGRAAFFNTAAGAGIRNDAATGGHAAKAHASCNLGIRHFLLMFIVYVDDGFDFILTAYILFFGAFMLKNLILLRLKNKI
jgi:hypothetical protein